MVLKIAARQSDLARLQAFEVGRALEKVSAGLKIEYAFRSSLGDQRADDPLWKMPEKGVFTEDFVADILSGAVDMVVHSWKDLPILDRTGTKIVATLPRADARDVLLVRRDRWAKRATSAENSPFRILTSSPRRVYNLEPFLKWALPWPGAIAPELQFVPVRGNIATRVGKLVSPAMDEAFDGLVVAKAALDRLLTSGQYGDPFIESAAALRRAIQSVEFVVLPLSVNPAAAAQGALAIEVRSDRQDLISLCAKVDASEDRECVEAERRELARHGGGCHQKIGVTVLRRPYGKIEFIRGLTDAGLILTSMSLENSKQASWPKPSKASEVVSMERATTAGVATERGRIAHPKISTVAVEPLHARGLFVARAEAWPDDDVLADAFVWTAGLSTWKKLSERGVWVHGSAEGLGEDDDTRLEIMAGKKIDWLRLTHEGATDLAGRPRASRAMATYKAKVQVPSVEALKQGRYFYWRSGTQFQAALQACPDIQNGYHATGPGHTHAAVKDGLLAAGLSAAEIDSRLMIFLNESEFRSYLT